MSRADLCIGAGGVTSLERCCLGLPSLIITIAENQISLAKALAYSNAARYLGDVQTVSVDVIISALNEFVFDAAYLDKFASYAKNLVDGFGVERVLEKMVQNMNNNTSLAVFL